VALHFARLNADKKSAAIDLREERGRELIRRLVPHYDIVIENFRPGRLESWGLGYQDLVRIHPGLIMVRISGYGQTGPHRHRPGFATVAEAISGIAYINGWPDRPPTSPPFGLGDYVAGLAGAFGALMAIVQRDHGGGGQEVDVAIYEPLLSFFGDAVLRYSALGEIVERAGNSGGGTSPRGIFRCKDHKWVAISGSSQAVAERLFEVMGHGCLLSDPRFATNSARVENNDAVNDMVETWVATMDRAELLDVLEGAQVAAGPVNTAEDIVSDEHFRARGSIRDFVSDALGPVTQTGPVLRMAGFEREDIHDPPGLGQHTAEALLEVGVSDDDLLALHDAQVVRWPERF
jgi:crotonobetainyl-CoA:carnitine CoA-transferase CaiB-like acyl-CoA transferase